MLIRNTAANLAGQLLYPVLALALVPFYIRHLGLEGYGLIGVMALVASLLSVFSRGLGAGLQREVGRRSRSSDASTLRRLLRSIEGLYWAIGGLFGVVLGIFAVAFGPQWVQTQTIPSGTVAICLGLLAARIAFAFPHSVYQAVFIGTEQQVLGSVLNAALALTSALAGVIGVLAFGSVVALFATEALTAAAYLVVFRRLAYGVLPAAPATFDPGEIRQLIGISLALMWTSGVGLLLANLDRLVVSAILPVTALAVYTVAVMGSRFVTLFAQPFLQATYPRMCHVTRAGTPEDQAHDLLRNAAVMIVLAAAFGLPLSGFAAEVLVVWVGDAAVVHAGAPVLSLYVLANVLIAFASVFYQWQTATGRTGTAVTFNTAALIWFPVTLWVLVSRAGLPGAAMAWGVYAVLAWVVNLAATFQGDTLPAGSLRAYLTMTAFGLVPAALATIAARLVADTWFAEALPGRVAAGVVAGIAGGTAALLVLLPRLGGRGLMKESASSSATGALAGQSWMKYW